MAPTTTEIRMLSAGCLLAVLMALSVGSPPAAPTQYTDSDPAAEAETTTIRVPGTTVSFDLAACPAGTMTDGEGDPVEIPPMLVLTTEVTWDLYDIFVYKLDESDGSSDADAVSRPSKPYVPPDRGFGHDGYPAMGMTRKAAEQFCEWLSLKLDLPVRLPTPHEWTYLAAAGGDAPYCCGLEAESLGEAAWTRENSEHTTHPVGHKTTNAFGLFDVHGNVAEWVITDSRRPLAMGGSYRDPADQCTAHATQQQTNAWNQSDPQIPKSRWWLADCSWVGFRFVIDATDGHLEIIKELSNE
ncbi:MAG: SUMF1/EgtB/PvdO family nonheme iron enzyme [Phycisphaerales bacterium]